MLIIAPINIENALEGAASEISGNVTVLAAIHRIAKKYLIREVDVKHEIARALLTGQLLVRNQAGFPYQPPVCDLSVEWISIEDLNVYFASHGHDYRLYPGDLAEKFENLKAGSSPFAVTRISVKEVRINAILSYLAENGIDPMRIPKGWYKVLQKHLTEELKLCTESGFYDAWCAGRGKRFMTANHQINGRRYT